MTHLEEYLLPSLTTSAHEIPGAQMMREQATPKDCPLTSSLNTAVSTHTNKYVLKD